MTDRKVWLVWEDFGVNEVALASIHATEEGAERAAVLRREKWSAYAVSVEVEEAEVGD